MPQSDLFNKIFQTLPDGDVQAVTIGLNWTVAVVETQGETRAGLASNFSRGGVGEDELAQVQVSGFIGLPALEVATQISAPHSFKTSIAAAVINALLPRQPGAWKDINAEEVIAQYGADKNVVMVGHFPFTDDLRKKVGQLSVLEKQMRPGDLPAESAPDVIPMADVVAITGTTLLNGTFHSLMELCNPYAKVIVLGPTTFLSPVLFDYGADILCGSVVVAIDAVLHSVLEARSFSQVHKAGVRLVALSK